MEDVEREAGVQIPKVKRGPLLPSEAEVTRRMAGQVGTGWRSNGYLSKRAAAAAAKELEASAGGSEKSGERPGGAEQPAPKRINLILVMPPPPAMPPIGGKPKGFALPEAATSESGIPSGSEHTVESVLQEEATHKERRE